MNLKCDRGETIQVMKANYGRTSTTICTTDIRFDVAAPMYDQNCASENSFRIVNEKCSNKRSCSVPVNNDVFTDPCRGTYKYLEVDYICTF